MTRVADLAGAELALWVGRVLAKLGDASMRYARIIDGSVRFMRGWGAYAPHEDWAQGGPLIERHRILIFPEMGRWTSTLNGVPCIGDTALIAAMRALVASVYGEEVENG